MNNHPTTIHLGSARRCRLAYQPTEQIELRASEHRLENVETFSKVGTFCYCGLKRDRMYCVFRGSQLEDVSITWRDVLLFRAHRRLLEKMVDFKVDAQRKLVGYQMGPGRVHSGFVNALEKVWPSIHHYYHRAGVKEVIWEGHSLGGALSVIAAAHLAGLELNRPKQTIRTFGQPRVGNRAFMHHVCKYAHLSRTANCADIVSLVPLLGYRHDQTELRYFDGEWNLNIDPSRLYQCLDRNVERFYAKSVLRFGLRQHFIDHYLFLENRIARQAA